MAKGLAHQITHATPGMVVAAIANRTLQKAADAYRFADERLEPRVVSDGAALTAAIERGIPAITDDPLLLTRCPLIDVIVDLTGAVELGAVVTMDAIANGTHMVLMNAELDATVGPIIKTYADRAGVIVSAADGDQPAVQINLHRFVTGLGLIPGCSATSRASRTSTAHRRRRRASPSSGARTRRW